MRARLALAALALALTALAGACQSVPPACSKPPQGGYVQCVITDPIYYTETP